MVKDVRQADIFMGTPSLEVPEGITTNRKKFLRCLIARRPIEAGEIFTEENTGLKRPLPDKRGLDAEYYDIILGKKSLRALETDVPITEQDIEDFHVA